MPTTDPSYIRQLHTDRTARLSRRGTWFKLPSPPTPRSARTKRDRVVAWPATTS